MIIHTVSVYPKKFTSKPTDEEIKKYRTGINDAITKHSMNLTPKGVAEICAHGQTWLTGYFKGKRCNKNWKGQSLFVLDFDNTKLVAIPGSNKKLKVKVDNPISFQNVLERLKEHGLDCTFAYNTFSHTETWHKFRVVFQLSYCIRAHF